MQTVAEKNLTDGKRGDTVMQTFAQIIDLAKRNTYRQGPLNGKRR